ncbi:MAG: phosphoglycerate kinase [Patescibacteria group bacterium]
MQLPKITDAPIAKGTRVLIRVDFNVPLERGRVTDASRLEDAKETIQYVTQRGGLVRLITHLGRPEGKIVRALSAKTIVPYLEKIIKCPVDFVRDPTILAMLKKYDSSPRVMLFENIRFWPGEKQNSRAFARLIARWGDIYINDAFSVSHRRHASVAALARLLPSYAGFSFIREVDALSNLTESPAHPFVVILGGAKISTKAPLIAHLMQIADHILVGGAIANAFFARRGLNIGKSFLEKETRLLLSRSILRHAKIHLPRDVVLASSLRSPTPRWRVVAVEAVGKNDYIADIGPETIAEFSRILASAKTVLWNGPLGFAEIAPFEKGTREVLAAIPQSARAIAGGGDSVALLKKLGMENRFDYISTAGGAMLEFLSGKKLPGIETLRG